MPEEKKKKKKSKTKKKKDKKQVKSTIGSTSNDHRDKKDSGPTSMASPDKHAHKQKTSLDMIAGLTVQSAVRTGHRRAGCLVVPKPLVYNNLVTRIASLTLTKVL